MNRIVCPLCNSKEIEINEIPYPLFRHMDFSIFHPGPNRICCCHECQFVFRVVSGEERNAIRVLYTSEEYLQHEEPHTLVIDGYDEPVPLSLVQAKLLFPLLPVKEPAVLDIGCFDGRLLLEIGKLCKPADLCGFDVAERPQFPKGPRFRFISGDMGTINGRFDLIVMSHSMQYIRPVQHLFEIIRSLLKPNGRLFVQVPDFSVKPCSLLFGDLFYHYDQNAVCNLLASMGLNATFLDNNFFPRDILVVASPGNRQIIPRSSENSNLESCLRNVVEMSKRLDQLSGLDALGVLGTTIEASFVNYLLGPRVSFFVDENPRKVGSLFQGKPIVHPESLLNNDFIVIPMGKAGEKIRERLSSTFNGKYIRL